ncbi:MAG TPA: hypothetical protein VHM20_05245, partial [Gammaproteobacteria bacterium]|nr:hypothetical protein [Gammaproteobacteria bacterium]
LFPAIKSFTALENAVTLSTKPVVRFAALTQSLALSDYFKLCERYRLPTDFKELGELVIKFFDDCQNVASLSDEKLVELLGRLDVFRREGRFFDFLLAAEACGLKSADELKKYYHAAKNIDVKHITSDKSLSGKDIADKIIEKRIEAVAECRSGKA